MSAETESAIATAIQGAEDIPKHDAQGQSPRAESAEWPEPLPLNSELPPVQLLCNELVPLSFRPLVQDIADRMQVPLDYPAVATMLCLAGVVSRRASIQPKAQDTGWIVIPNLWGGIIAPPGFMKSPVIQAATRALNQIQAEWRQQYEDDLANHVRTSEESDLRRQAWREQFKAHAKGQKAAPARPEDEPEEPTPKRLIVNDATFEALHQTMSENPAGVLVLRDELTGWWSQLDRPGREGERAFSLQAWNGDTAHTIDRIGRGTIHVPACCLSMLGGIQPGRLRSYLADALDDGPSNDGLIQRFQLLIWPDTSAAWTYVDRAPSPLLERQAENTFRKLVGLDPENPARFRFAADAQALFIDWLSLLEQAIRGDQLHPALVCHLSKYRKLMPALALLLELADRASCDGFDGLGVASSRLVVSLDHAKQAAAWCDYLDSHARRVYSCVVNPQLRAARELSLRIRKRQAGASGSFSCREIYLKGWSGLGTPDSVRLATEVLQDARWIREMSVEPGPMGGRPSSRYVINPRVWE